MALETTTERCVWQCLLNDMAYVSYRPRCSNCVEAYNAISWGFELWLLLKYRDHYICSHFVCHLLQLLELDWMLIRIVDWMLIKITPSWDYCRQPWGSPAVAFSPRYLWWSASVHADGGIESEQVGSSELLAASVHTTDSPSARSHTSRPACRYGKAVPDWPIIVWEN